MDSLNEFPEIMVNARIDLAGHVSGQFSPEDWTQILREAQRRLNRRLQEGEPAGQAWPSVIREFSGERHWGYVPNWRAPAKAAEEKTGFGLGSIWMVFSAFVITKIAVVWLGQIYTTSDDPKDKYLFLGAVGLVILNFGYFLWRTRKYKD